MFLPHFDVLCDLLLDRCTATWHLFVLYNKEINFVRIKAALFRVRRAKRAEVGPSPFWQTRKKPFYVIYDVTKMKESHWLPCVDKELWLVWVNHATVKLDSSVASCGINLQRRKTCTSKSTIRKENAGKVESVFVIRSAQLAKKLGCCLEYCRSWKIRSENLRLRSTWRPFDLSFKLAERSVSDGGNLCPLWSVILKSVSNSVTGTF